MQAMKIDRRKDQFRGHLDYVRLGKNGEGPETLKDSGAILEAEHRVRTGDLGKAPMRMCIAMQQESSRWNLRRSRSPRARQFCKPMQPESTALLTPD